MKVMIWGQKPRPSWLTISAPRAPSANQMDVSPTVTASPIPNRTRMISQMMGFIDGSFLDRGIDPRLVRWIRAAQPSAGCSGACHGRVSRCLAVALSYHKRLEFSTLTWDCFR